MKKKHPYRRLHMNRAYSLSEISKVLGVHIRTVQDWVRQGLPVFNKPSRPYLVMSGDVQQFLLRQRGKLGRHLEQGEFMCLTCHAPCYPVPGSVTVIPTGHRMGKDKIQIRSQGTCPNCGGKISRLGVQDQKNNNQQSTAPLAFQ